MKKSTKPKKLVISCGIVQRMISFNIAYRATLRDVW